MRKNLFNMFVTLLYLNNLGGDKLATNQRLLDYAEPQWADIVTPVKVNVLSRLMQDSNYDQEKSACLVEGFTHGF